MTRYFEYGTDAVDYLKAKDKKLGAAIDAVGIVRREMDEDDLFSAIVHQIIGQQISTAAQATIWNRMRERLGEVTSPAVCAATEEELQSCGITFTKARYIKSCAEKVASGQFDLDAVREMDDAEAIAALSSLEGVGVWTAEMLLLFCLGRPDILSYGDLAIRRGMRMVYHHRKVTREMFERYRRRYSPYGSVASLYLWAISSMDVLGYERDFAPKKVRVAKKGKSADGAVGAKGQKGKKKEVFAGPRDSPRLPAFARTRRLAASRERRLWSNVAWRMPRLLRWPGPLRTGQYGIENASRSPMW